MIYDITDEEFMQSAHRSAQKQRLRALPLLTASPVAAVKGFGP